MEGICSYCEQPLETTAQTELLCHHRFHTHCILSTIRLRMLGPDPLPHLHCQQCQTVFLEDGAETDEEENNDAVSVASSQSYQSERTRIRNLWDTNPTFRRDIKNYMKSSRAVSKPRTALQKLIAEKKAEVTPIYAPLKLKVEGLYNVKKDEIMASQQLQAFRSADASFRRYHSNLQRKYGMRLRHFAYLRDKPGCKRIPGSYSYYRNSPKYMISSALRFRYRRY